MATALLDPAAALHVGHTPNHKHTGIETRLVTCIAADQQERKGPKDLLPLCHAECDGGREEHQ